MADYTPPYIVGEIATGTASNAIKGGDLLTVTGNGTLGAFTPGANPVGIVGVAAQDAASGARVTYYGRGPQHESIADGTVTAGDLLVTATNASRQVRTLAAVTTPTPADVTNSRVILGIALTTASDNTKVRWMTF